MRKIDFGNLPNSSARKSANTYPAFGDTECESCGVDIWEGEDIGFVNNEKVCEDCWYEA